MQAFRHTGWALAITLLMAGAAGAQNVTSHLTGTVKDSQGAVLPGVTVTAASPALIGTQTAVTEANGSYQFPSLPPGSYTLTFGLQGFQTFTRQNIVLALGQTLTVDAQMQLASLKENVTVTAESPVVDTQSTAVGNTMDTAKLIGVPTSTDLWGALAQSPGVRMEGFDVGGSHKSQQSGYTAFGITNQSRVITEGVDTTEGTGGAGFYQDYFSQNEISVSGAGQDVSMNTPGAAVISTIKSGGNQFKSLINQTYEGQSFVGSNTDANIEARGGTAQPNLLFWENHDDLGGPIKKDQLWFFAAYNHFHINKQISGVDPNVATDLGIFDNFTTKETWKPTSKDTLIGYYQWGKKQKPLRSLSVNTPRASTLAQVSPSWMFNGKWERVWTNRLFTELNIGNFGYDFPERPSVDYTTNPPRHDLATGVNSGAGFAVGGTYGPFELERAKPQVYGNATYYLPTKRAGSHDLKVGFEWINDMSNFGSIGTSGPILYLDSNGAPDEIRLTNLGDPSQLGSTWTIPQNSNKREAFYGQDRWTMNSRVTVTAGLRYDRQAPYYITGKTAPLLTEVFAATTVPGQTLFTRNNVAPRVGVSIDPKGDGRTAIKAFWGRYYFNFADTFSGVNPTGASSKTYKFLNTEGDGLYHGPQDLGQLISATGGTSTTFDPNIKTPYTDEIDASIQQQFWGESSIRLAYVRKMSKDNYTGNNNQSLNQAWIGQFTVPVTVPVTLSSIDGSGPQGTQDLTVFDVPPGLAGVVNNIIANVPGNPTFTYDTAEVAFNKRFSKGLFLDTSFDYTWV
ncbi:MAG TPA: carboxypeptidase regulatory-like domain-containing protein, partial [Vicinamibacterales bacterium]